MNDDRPGTPIDDAGVWQAVEPPQPTEAEWERVRRAIAAHCLTTPAARPAHRARARAALLAVAAASGLIALGVWWSSGPVAVPPVSGPVESVAVAPPPRPAVDPLADFAVLPVASPDEVWVESVRGHQPDWMIAADYPAAGEMPLAGPDDLIRLEVIPPAGRSDAIAVILAGRP